MRGYIFRTSLLLVILPLLLGLTLLQDQTDPASVDLEKFREVNDFVDDNELCFKCHSELKYELTDEFTERTVHRNICVDYVIQREDFYTSNHKSFACLDCHSYDFEQFPHPLEPRLEEPYYCIDCHGYDEDYAQYHFEEILEEYEQSVHYKANPDEFSCWKCHPHSYHISIRNTENLSETIIYDNAICLSCHADFNQFSLLTEREEINVIQTHDWLPNQSLHFKNVRCIECHTQINDSILVAHLVLPKEQAVRRCVECHSSNSILMATLYKFQTREARSELGYLNAVVMNDAYVIGANRNYWLNVISAALFGLTFLAILIHLFFRIRTKA